MDTTLSKTQRDTLQKLIEMSSAKNPLKAAEIKNVSGAKGPVSRIVRELQIKGFPIISAPGAMYYYAKNTMELSAHIAVLEEDLRESKEVVDGLKNAFPAVGAGTTAEISFTKRLPVRRSNGTIGYEEFKLDQDGAPIVPPGVNLV